MANGQLGQLQRTLSGSSLYQQARAQQGGLPLSESGLYHDDINQNEAALVRAAQQEQDPQRLQQIQMKLQMLAKERQMAQMQSQGTQYDGAGHLIDSFDTPDSQPLQQQQLGANELELRAKLDRTSNPVERAKLEDQIRGGRPGAGSLASAVPGAQAKSGLAGQAGTPEVKPEIQGGAGKGTVNPFLSGGIAGLTEETISGLRLFDANKESHRNLMKEIIQEKIDAGKPVDPDVLKTEVSERLRKLRKLELNDTKLLVSEKKELDKLNGTANAGYGKAALNKLDATIMGANDTLTMISGLDRHFDPALFDGWEQIKGDVGGFMERWDLGKVDPKTKRYMERLQSYRMNVTGMFNKYRQEVTGAAASEQELVRLEKAYVHMKLSKSQFKAGLKALRFNAVLSKEMAVLQKSIPPEQFSPGDVIDRIRSGGAKGPSEQRIARALKEYDKHMDIVSPVLTSDLDDLGTGSVDPETGKVTPPEFSDKRTASKSKVKPMSIGQAVALGGSEKYQDDPEIQRLLDKVKLKQTGAALDLLKKPKDPLGTGPISSVPSSEELSISTANNLEGVDLDPAVKEEMIRRQRGQ